MAVTDTHELGPLEIRVLEQLASGEARSVTEVQQLLQRAGQELAYTTVMTVLGRLHQKRVVSRRKDGKRYLYSISSSSKRCCRDRGQDPSRKQYHRHHERRPTPQ